MNVKKSLESRIRGWLPKDLILPAHALPNQKKTGRIRSIFLNFVIGFLVIAGFFSVFILIDSWIKFVLLGLILVGGLVWRFSHGDIKKKFKFFVVAVLIFLISFTAVEFNLIWNAGYPAASVSAEPNVTISYPSMLNISLTQLIQGIENSPTFGLLTTEHGKTNPETIKLDSGFGWIQVDFYGEGSNTFLGFLASRGDQYHVQISYYSGQPFSSFYVQSSSQQAFAQIDALGLQWFYNSAIEIAQNRTGSTPKIDSLSLTMNFEDHGQTYQGITLLLVGSSRENSTLISGSSQEASKLIADFEPNGTLLYMSQPQQHS